MKPRIAADTPAALGYRMPAEWEPQQATWLAWPHNRTDWPGKFEPIPYVYAEIVRHLARAARVELIVNDSGAEARARKILTEANVLPALQPRIEFHQWPTNRGWLRDSGPIFVKDKAGSVALSNWKFNAWAKYKNWQLDNALPEKIARLRGCKLFQAVADAGGYAANDAAPVADAGRQMVLEGGSIDVNGRGLLLTTEECLLSPMQQRNPGMTREQIEAALGRMLGVKKVLWLERGIVGDDTHGHVDDVARFVGPRTVLAASEADPADPNHTILKENSKRLKKMTDTAGRALEVVSLPMPSPVVFKGQRVPASYANFYISNRTVLVPTFDDANDLKALNIIQRAMPKHSIVPIYCGDLIWGLGAIHCMTQQEPAEG
ncbi:MAG: agmatine deiminase family protein [Candidatus Korobacteraceae bacterium]|jgi:agmatine deiminase